LLSRRTLKANDAQTCGLAPGLMFLASEQGCH
jgi:hypothetical protein